MTYTRNIVKIRLILARLKRLIIARYLITDRLQVNI